MASVARSEVGSAANTAVGAGTNRRTANKKSFEACDTGKPQIEYE
jgi:hypothetical protein